MRALSLVLLLATLAAKAETPSAKLSTNIKAEGGSTGINTSSAANSTTKQLSYNLSSGTIQKSIFRIGLDQVFPDYGRVLITDRNGLSAPLSTTSSASEFSLRPSLEYSLPFVYLTLNGAKTVSKSPYPSTMGSLTLAKELYETGTKLSVNYTQSKNLSPSTFYIDPDTFRSEQRATQLTSKTYSASIEQILSERLKLKWKNSLHIRSNKPNYPETELIFGWAIADQAALISKSGASRELKSEKPSEDRGYLSAYWQDLEFRYDFSSRWSAKANVGTMLETETSRGATPYQRVGTDSIGAGVQGTFSKFIVSANASGSYANTGYRSGVFGGELTWQF